MEARDLCAYMLICVQFFLEILSGAAFTLAWLARCLKQGAAGIGLILEALELLCSAAASLSFLGLSLSSFPSQAQEQASKMRTILFHEAAAC
eukprot:1161130-Pelagomonas_calceolata.AAC.5